MKKLAFAACFAALMAAGSAHAEHRLLITDVLDAKQFEAQAAWEYTHLAGDIDADISELPLSVGVGLGKGLELSASIPYVFHNEEHESGFGKFGVGLKYKIMREAPVTVTAGIDMRLSGGDGEDEKTELIPSIAVSKELHGEMKPYAAYALALISDESPVHALKFGVEKEIDRMITLDGRLSADFHTGEFAYQQYGLELAAYVQVAPNLYVIPAFGPVWVSGDGFDSSGVKIAAGIYKLF